MLNQSDGTTSLGLVPFKPAAVMEAEKVDQARQAHEANKQGQAQAVSGLASYIDACWQKAKQAKDPVDRQMLKNLRQRNGVYEGDKLAAIQKMGGSQVYVLLTATKCRAAEAWINDLLRPVGERPWSVNPTPVPELPGDIQQQIITETQAVYSEVMRQANALGQQVNQSTLREEIREYAETQRDKALREVQEEAKLRAERMAQKMDDQLEEGGWQEAFWGAISDLVTLKAGIIKGPVLRKRSVTKWAQGGPTGWQITTVDEIVPEFYRVSPFDLFPAPEARHPNDGFLIERHTLTRSELNAMIGVPGYNEENIRKVLADYGTGLHSSIPADSERAAIEFSGIPQQLTYGEKIEALEFWGSVQGKLLVDWGVGEQIDPELDYEVNAWKIGQYVIRAILNPDKLGRKPYSVDSFERIAGSFWGRGVPELMADIQDVCNAVARAIVNNAALASGPQVEVNIDRCSDSEEIWPWKIWQGTNRTMSEAPAIRFYQPAIITGPLLQVYEAFATMSEDQTGIPRYAYGNMNVSGAGATASGLSMLMTSANRNIKEVLSHVDKMVGEVVARLYDYNMMYDPDPDIKGDCRIVARGTASILAKEQRTARISDTLQRTANPIDAQILGVEGRATLLREAFKGLDIPVDDIPNLSDGAALRALVEKVSAQQAQALAAQGQGGGMSPPGGSQTGDGAAPPPAPQALDAAGNPAGGTDVNTFQNQQGATP